VSSTALTRPSTLAIERCELPKWNPVGEMERRPRGVSRPMPPCSWADGADPWFDATASRPPRACADPVAFRALAFARWTGVTLECWAVVVVVVAVFPFLFACDLDVGA
jgi:hypothetical protein